MLSFKEQLEGKMPIVIPGIDAETVHTLYDDDAEVYEAILRSFVSRIPAVLDKIRDVSSETLPDYRIKIHALKGSGGNVGAKELVADAARLEAMAKDGDLAGVQAGNRDFLEKTGVLLKDIRSWLEQFGAPI
jgi:HPt (histidine-containing phosphotransfer) domain-containing protein